MNYDHYMFISPPRPKSAIPSDRLAIYDGNGWIAQPKLNGTYNCIAVGPDKTIIAAKRDGKRHARWRFDENNSRAFKTLPKERWYVFCAELLNDKTPHIKNVNYIHDILVCNGKVLIGTTYPERHKILQGLFPDAAPNPLGYTEIDRYTWLAQVYDSDFQSLYSQLSVQVECEGLVLKNTTTRLSLGDTTLGMVKCRKPTKNYSF